MSYSQKRIPNAPYEFPPPPAWLVWMGDRRWDKPGYPPTGEGQVRHYPDLHKAKAKVSPGKYNNGEFFHDWSIYCWDTKKGEYVLQYEGKRGENKNLNPLFGIRVKKGEHVPRAGFDDEVEKAIQSIKAAL